MTSLKTLIGKPSGTKPIKEKKEYTQATRLDDNQLEGGVA